MRHRFVDHLLRLALELLPALQSEAPQRVYDLSLLIHDIIVLEEPLTRLEILQLDTLLCLLDGARDERMRKYFAFLRTQAIHESRDALGTEDAHQVVFQ